MKIEDFHIGDTVQIINPESFLFGENGKVIDITNCTVVIELFDHMNHFLHYPPSALRVLKRVPGRPRWVVCAALRSRKTGQVIAGARHWDSIMRGIALVDKKTLAIWQGSEQGFIDQYGQFMDRQEAFKVAKANNQIRRSPIPDDGTLYSEDLY
jgi:hypothetical protein